MQSLQQAFQYVNYGQNHQNVWMQCQQFSQQFTQFSFRAEAISFPNEPKSNYLVIQGSASSGHPLKIILPTTYPMSPPRIYFDMQMQQSALMQLPYINKQNMQIEAQSVGNWRANYTLVQAVTDTCTTLLMQPPGGAPVAPQQTQAWGGQVAQQHQQHQPQQQQQYNQQTTSSPQALMQEIEEINTQYYLEVTKAVNALVDSKVAVHAHDKVLDDQIDDFKSRLSVIDGNIDALNQENEQLQKVINESQSSTAISSDNIDSHCYAQNPLSEKLIKFQCKVNALEDAMGVVKKAFDNDAINLEEYLKAVRSLAKKQCKSIIKTNRLVKGTSNPNPQDMPSSGGMAPQQMPGMAPPMAPSMGQPGMMAPPMGQPGMMAPPMGQPGMAPMGGQPGGMQMMQPGMMGQPMMGQQPGMYGQPQQQYPGQQRR